MPTEVHNENLPDDTAQDQVRRPPKHTDEVGDTALEIHHEKLPAKGSAPMTTEEINREAIKRFKGYKYGKYALKAKTAGLRREPIQSGRDRSSGNRRRKP
jgi:hypothetical protein